ncbi:ATP-dependent nuclease [Enterovibrio norvegicus]|uniref:ATP-dependent nuclease n=1 Tax=Enterovibrio norvegicus TaxID=188144 RepID=UPI0013D8D401|nr:AAA family ATPase [Enterovibrio norvegicus]
MSLKIQRIEIKNFRSIRNLTITPNQLAVLVGKNDSGKSNVLRALNLFFNGKTDQDKDLDFKVDHNIFNLPNRRAKEIIVKVELSIPENYRRVNGNIVVWEKRWRDNGLVHNEYVGHREVVGPRRGVYLEELAIPERSNLHALLRNIKFIYVPAIKDLKYFSLLRASIYDVIAEVANREFRDSSRDFEQSISNQLDDLTQNIRASLGLNSRLALPRNLSHIFESLDFLSDEQDISLDVRGDGVKARHIPLILKFMADKTRSLQGRGAQPYNFIWAYEEPENSLELSSAIELADQFWDFVNSSISQVFLSTHSPVFYNLHRKEESVSQISCHHMYKSIPDHGTKEASELGDLDERMGTTALFASMVEKLEERVREREVARIEAETLAEANRRKLFVEGPSDKNIIEKAISVFIPHRSKDIDVETKDSAGINYVIDMLQSWRNQAKHHPELMRAAGLLDLDPEAIKAAKAWNGIPENIHSAKCFKLPKPQHIIPILQAGFSIPVVLETIYDHNAWLWAEENNHLQERNILTVIPSDLNSRIIAGDTTLNESLQEEWGIYIRKEFNKAGKGPMSRHFCNKSEQEFRERFSCLEQLMLNIEAYLFQE